MIFLRLVLPLYWANGAEWFGTRWMFSKKMQFLTEEHKTNMDKLTNMEWSSILPNLLKYDIPKEIFQNIPNLPKRWTSSFLPVGHQDVQLPCQRDRCGKRLKHLDFAQGKTSNGDGSKHVRAHDFIQMKLQLPFWREGCQGFDPQPKHKSHGHSRHKNTMCLSQGTQRFDLPKLLKQSGDTSGACTACFEDHPKLWLVNKGYTFH